MKVFFLSVSIMLLSSTAFSQQPTQQQLDSLKNAVFDLNNEVNTIKLSLTKARSNLTMGILVATVGYSVTILGGQLLASNPQAGEILLYTGGAIGIGGTIVLMNGFRKLRLKNPEKVPR